MIQLVHSFVSMDKFINIVYKNFRWARKVSIYAIKGCEITSGNQTFLEEISIQFLRIV